MDNNTELYSIHNAETNMTGFVIRGTLGYGAFLRDDDAGMVVQPTVFYPTVERARQAVIKLVSGENP